eukprot:6327634-Lingulodinium_polyedra.AAC.1
MARWELKAAGWWCSSVASQGLSSRQCWTLQAKQRGLSGPLAATLACAGRRPWPSSQLSPG